MNVHAPILRSWGWAVLALVCVAPSVVFFPPPAAAETYTVTVGPGQRIGEKGSGLGFEPAEVTAKAGDTIVWVINKLGPHNVVFDRDNNPARSADLAKSMSVKQLLMTPGQTVKTTIPFDAPPGEYLFYCEPHRGAGEVGKLIIVK